MHSIFQAFVAQTSPQSGMMSILPIVFVVAVFYLLVLRPQVKQQKKHQGVLGALKKGDDVVTQGGIIGKIAVVEDRTVIIEVGGGNKLRVVKANITGLWVEKPAEAEGAKAEAKK